MKTAEKLYFYRSKTVSITGSTGLLGSHLLEILKNSCKEIRILVRKSTSKDEKGVTIIRGDIREKDAVDKIVKDADIIFHLAAVVSVDKSINDPLHTFQVNVMSTINLLECIRKQVTKPHLVFSSSAAVYGTPRTYKITEDHTIFPSNPYSASKAAADAICQVYNKTYDIPITILRPSTLYGPRQRATQFIPTVISQCLSSNTVRIGFLNAYRDFCYVKDVANAFILVSATPGARGQVLNISSGVATKIADVVAKVSRILGKKIKIKPRKAFYRPDEITSPFIIDYSKARKILGWAPYYDMDSGLKETIKWFRSFRKM